MIVRQTVTINHYRRLLDTVARESAVLDDYFAHHKSVQTANGTLELLE
jgi:hypothetical protein